MPKLEEKKSICKQRKEQNWNNIHKTTMLSQVADRARKSVKEPKKF